MKILYRELKADSELMSRVKDVYSYNPSDLDNSRYPFIYINPTIADSTIHTGDRFKEFSRYSINLYIATLAKGTKEPTEIYDLIKKRLLSQLEWLETDNEDNEASIIFEFKHGLSFIQVASLEKTQQSYSLITAKCAISTPRTYYET